MRLRALCLPAAALLCLSVAPTRLVADPPVSLESAVGVIAPVQPGDANCPVATHMLLPCPGLPPSVYLVFDKGGGKVNHSRGTVTVRGEADHDVCTPFLLIHVRRMAQWDGPPILCPDPPCIPPDCTPGR